MQSGDEEATKDEVIRALRQEVATEKQKNEHMHGELENLRKKNVELVPPPLPVTARSTRREARGRPAPQHFRVSLCDAGEGCAARGRVPGPRDHASTVASAVQCSPRAGFEAVSYTHLTLPTILLV